MTKIEKFKNNSTYLAFIVLLFCSTKTGWSQDKIIYENPLLQQQTPHEDKVNFTAFGNVFDSPDPGLFSSLRNAKDPTTRIMVLEKIADYHFYKGETDSILFYGDLILKTINEHKQKLKTINKNLSSAHKIMTEGYILNGLYENAIKYSLEGISAAENIPDSTEINYHRSNLARANHLKGDYLKALGLYNECLKSKVNSNTLLLKLYREIANTYLALANNDLARAFYFKASDLATELEDIKAKLQIDMGLGIIEKNEGNSQIAIQYFDHIKNSALDNGLYDLHIDAQNQIGNIWYNEGHYEQAQMALSMTYINAIRWNKLEQQKRLLNNLRFIFVKQGDYENAYNIMTQYLDVSNNIADNQNEKEIKELEIKYETLQKENKITTLENEQLTKDNIISKQKITRNVILIAFVIILIPIIALLYVYYQKMMAQNKLNKQQEEISKQKISSLLKQQELKLIKASMKGQNKERTRIARELHDSIGGNMASIKLSLSNLDKKNDLYGKLTLQIDETYQMIRDLSHNLIPKKFSQNAFSALITEYMEAIHKNNGIQTSFRSYPEKRVNTIDESLQVELYKILQELTTNTLKHANATLIDVEINIYEDDLKLIFEDNGMGFEKYKKGSKGIGLSNIYARITELNGEVHIDSKIKRGTIVIIDVPLKNKDEFYKSKRIPNEILF